jgi:hypothetical protein
MVELRARVAVLFLAMVALRAGAQVLKLEKVVDEKARCLDGSEPGKPWGGSGLGREGGSRGSTRTT